MKVSDFEFDLPAHLIADYPTKNRTDSRLLHLDARTGQLAHYHFRDLPELLNPADLLVFNNTRVIPARLFGSKPTGGKVEILLERMTGSNEAIVQMRASKPLRAGSSITLFRDETGVGEADNPVVEVLEKNGGFYRLRFPSPGVQAIADEYGHMPLPPYINRTDEPMDQQRYQTVYARHAGAVAAPTAGLHFDEPLLDRIAQKGVSQAEVTLHVGAGTFQPVRVDEVEQHEMHKEYLDVPESVCEQVLACRQKKGRVIAVGTTSVRCLESASTEGVLAPYRGDTDIFIYPGYEFQQVDALITNFHLSGSTLLMLVSAFAGSEHIRSAYQAAIDESYRFFSYGDAMLITR